MQRHENYKCPQSEDSTQYYKLYFFSYLDSFKLKGYYQIFLSAVTEKMLPTRVLQE